ncbi:hypothetical protein CDD81_6489 [Ophiocordyceps australis]|uniref:Uncharacterized protein n=1 Tax=Ophiocordyceps australis TaxID=1399860 RepID=A0A2C5YH79_9HYPO|nr:hypothetical protein CDD81_6489 [Ophiocordyceps australis]
MIPLWWTGTGDNRIHDQHSVELTVDADGHYRLEPAMEGEEHGMLHLSNSGRLRITGQCDLYLPPQERHDSQTLAVIVAGLYRTHAQACPTHVKSLIQNNKAFHRVDIFAYILYEQSDATQKDSIETAIKDCYGANLRRLEVRPVHEVEEDYPGGPESILEPCGNRLQRLNNQLKTISLAGAMWRSWTIEQGEMHDVVMRIRPDTSFVSDEQLPFWTLAELGSDKLVLPHPKAGGEHYFYCAQMSGQIVVGPTDQIAYGSPAAMGHWLSMYHYFPQIVHLASNRERPAHRDFSGSQIAIMT